MEKLQFDTGVKEYEINDTCTVRFNPCDPVFTERLFKVFDKLGKMQEDGEKQNVDTTDGERLFEMIHERDREMRADIDSIFDEAVCDKLFKDVGVYALAGGLPLWANFLMAIMDEVDASIVAEHAKGSPRVDHYMKKYGKYVKK